MRRIILGQDLPGLAPQARKRRKSRLGIGGAFNSTRASALILNAGYEPVKVVSWKKAILLWLQNKVEVIEFHRQTVASPSRHFLLPSVLRLKTYVKPHYASGVRLSRQNIFLRDHSTCQYCRTRISEKKLTIDHVVPLSRGGTHTWTNVVAACSSCNNKKGSKTPDQANMKLLKIPVAPKWLPNQELDVRTDRMPSAWQPYLSFLKAWS